MKFEIRNETDGKQEDRDAVLASLEHYNDAHATTPFKRLQVRFFARDPNGRILGGLFGSVTFHWLKIEVLWVEEAMRGQGVGEALVQRAEAAAHAAGAIASNVETTSFQARPFYERLGYVVFAHLDDYPIGDVTWFLKKMLR